MKQTLRIIVLALFANGCGATDEERVGDASVDETKSRALSGSDELDSRIAHAQEELRRIDAEIEAKREEVRFLSCKAEVEDLKAEVGLARSQCMLELAEQAECKANVERAKGDSSLLGCAFGLAAAAFTGGSAAPWALGGCAAGRAAGELSAKECPLPECVESSEQMMLTALEKRGWSRIPQCGGQLGVDVETPSLGLVGVLKVIKPGRLGKAGVQKGDRIAYVFEERVKTPESLEAQLTAHAGRDVEVSFVREDKMYKGHLTVPVRVSSLNYRTEKEYRVTHKWSARVQKVSDDSPLVGKIAAGRDITHVDGEEVVNEDHLRQLLRYRQVGEEVTLSLRTPNSLETDSLKVKLESRKDKWTL